MAKDLFDFDVQVEEKKTDFSEQLKLANGLCIREQFDRAIKIYNDILDKDLECEEAYVGLLRAHSKDFSIYEGEEIETDIRVIEKLFPDIINEDYLNYISKRNKNVKSTPVEKEKPSIQVAKQEEKKDAIAAIKEGDMKALKKAIKNLKKVVLPNWVKVVPSEFFEGMELDEVIIPDSVTTIKPDAFFEASVEKLVIGKNVKTILDNFEYMVTPPSIIEVNEDNDYLRIEDDCFIYTDEDEDQYLLVYLGDKTKVKIPDGVRMIGSQAFYHVKDKLKTVIAPDSLTIISDYAFLNCKELVEFKGSFSLKTIGAGAFEGCRKLSHFEWFNFVETIATDAFKDCKSLTDVHLSTVLNDYIFKDAFNGCSNLVIEVNGSKSEGCPRWHKGWDNGVKEVKWSFK